MTTASSSGPTEEDLQEALAYIRPLLKGHSGDLTIASVEDGVITVDFHNACHSCPAISVTFAGLVRSRLLQVDGVKDVRSGRFMPRGGPWIALQQLWAAPATTDHLFRFGPSRRRTASLWQLQTPEGAEMSHSRLSFRLDDGVAMVTGGASGIGSAIQSPWLPNGRRTASASIPSLPVLPGQR
ncbi:protein involved in iron-sulfur cluster assembly [Arthrobacter sp. Hiyo6]|nr:protein involved in iron-sulfur cluster assembly [Arthrobacter sp. Hiyo6]